jgi:hypothetical protein
MSVCAKKNRNQFMSKARATMIGFLVAPLVSALIGVSLSPEGIGQDFIPRLALLPILYFFSAMAAILFGAPAFLLLARLKMISWWSVLGAGAIIGGLVAAVLRSPSPVTFQDILTMAPIGSASAFSFWLIYRRAHHQ